MSNRSTLNAPAVPFTQSGSSPPAADHFLRPLLAPGSGSQTLAIHAGLSPDPTTGSILTPIYQTATFAQRDLGETISPDGHTYSRCSNPTITALERNLAGLEGVHHALAFKTGLAAITTLLLTLLKPGDHVVAGEVMYGGSIRLLRDLLGGFGVETSFVDTTNSAVVAQAVKPNTKLLFVETPANPTLAVTDIAALASISKAAGVLLAVDNTFLTSQLQPVIPLGADISVLSTTKYVEGHDSTTGGALLFNSDELLERFFLTRSATGCIQAPFDAWLTLRGLKTLPLRLRQHCESALAIAKFLEFHPATERVYYPGLRSFPGFELASRQQTHGGGIVAFELNPEQVRPFIRALRLTTLAENLGAAETLITHPASMTHSQIPPETRERLGIAEGLLRLSVGLEDAADIIEDLKLALEAVSEAQVTA